VIATGVAVTIVTVLPFTVTSGAETGLAAQLKFDPVHAAVTVYGPGAGAANVYTAFPAVVLPGAIATVEVTGVPVAVATENSTLPAGPAPFVVETPDTLTVALTGVEYVAPVAGVTVSVTGVTTVPTVTATGVEVLAL
jgi:hypothetical protein